MHYCVCQKRQLKYLASDKFYFHFSYWLSEWAEVVWNPKSNRCWKFQFSILKNKKVLFLKKFFLAVPPRYIQKMALAVSIFQKVLELSSCTLKHRTFSFSCFSYWKWLFCPISYAQIFRNPWLMIFKGRKKKLCSNGKKNLFLLGGA